MKAVLLGLSLFVSSLSVHAANFTSVSTEGNFEGVKLITEASVEVDGREHNLALTGYGLRKKVLIFPLDVYVGQFLTSVPESFVRDTDNFETSLASIGTIPASVMHLTFKRRVTGQQISDAVYDALAANGIESRADINALAKAITNGATASRDETMIFISEIIDANNEVITYIDPNGEVTTVQGTTGFVVGFLSSWFGKTNDRELAKTRTALIGAR